MNPLFVITATGRVVNVARCWHLIITSTGPESGAVDRFTLWAVFSEDDSVPLYESSVRADVVMFREHLALRLGAIDTRKWEIP